MRVALLADIHANLAAFEAAIRFVSDWQPDQVVIAGDLINRGPRPAECLDLARAQAAAGWHLLRGNHEDYVLHEARASADRPDWERKLCAHTAWTLNQVRGRLDGVADWPDAIELAGPRGTCLRFLHASRLGNRAGLYHHMGPDEFSERVDADCDVFGVGHTHVPLVRRHGRPLVVNAGAVGMPFDGDPRSAMALLEYRDDAWQVRIERLDYDRARTEQDFRTTGYLADGGPMTPLIHQELQQARPRLGVWHHHFEQRVRSGQLTIEASVAEMLNEA